jgi:hypothetical protein
LWKDPVRAESLQIIDRSISQLRELAGALAEEIGSASASQVPLTPARRSCKEVLLTLSVLLPKLEAARRIKE